MPEYPEFAWFEGIVNAITHRNYCITGDHIKVFLYDNRMEILSPGFLPNVVTIENIKNTRYSRNPRIARFLTEYGWVKELNEGVKRMYEEMENYFLDAPKYSQPSENVLLLTLENNISNRNLRINDKLKEIIDNKIFDTLNDYEKQILHYMYNSGNNITTKLSAQIIKKSVSFSNKILKGLVEKNLLKWNGTSKTDTKQYYTVNL